MNTNSLLEQARKFAREGDHQQARDLLLRVIQQEPHNDVAWELFADVVETKEQSVDCLKRALQANPSNASAKNKLAALTKAALPTAKVSSPSSPLPPVLVAPESKTQVDEQTVTSQRVVNQPTGSPKLQTAVYKGHLTVTIILLALVLVINLFQVTSQVIRGISNYRKVQAAEELVQKQQKLILGLMDDYKKAAYDNPAVGRITEQQLMATEYNLAALQVIAIQNSQIIELLANGP